MRLIELRALGPNQHPTAPPCGGAVRSTCSRFHALSACRSLDGPLSGVSVAASGLATASWEAPRAEFMSLLERLGQWLLRLARATAECPSARQPASGTTHCCLERRERRRARHPRMWRDLRYHGERCGRHRVARLMRAHDLQGIPQRRRWQKKGSVQSRGDREPPGTGLCGGHAEPEMGHRHHARPHRRVLAVPIRGDRPALGSGGRLGR